MNLGYDYIVIETNDIVSFLKETKKHQLTLFHLHQLDTLRYSFYVPIYQRYITSSMHLPIQKAEGDFFHRTDRRGKDNNACQDCVTL